MPEETPVHEPCPEGSPPADRLRVLLVDDGAHRVQLIREELALQGHEVVGVIDPATLIHDCVSRLAPDVVIVDSESPTRDRLENLATLSARHPRPVVVFAEDLCDDLVDRRVLDLARPEARVLHVGKRGGRASTDQRFIQRVMIREARRGLRVVRLKGGDPFVSGRGGEERDALHAAGIAVEVVPGVTAGFAAPAAVGIAVTDRRHAAGVAFVTGRRRADGSEPDRRAPAASGLALVVCMGVARCAAIADGLIGGGLAPDTPAAAIAAAHTPRQRHAVATLATLADALARHGIASLAVLVVGDVVAGAQATLARSSARRDAARAGESAAA